MGSLANSCYMGRVVHAGHRPSALGNGSTKRRPGTCAFLLYDV